MALTLVLPRAADEPAWDLGGDPDTLGVRVPHHPLALAVLAASGPARRHQREPLGRAARRPRATNWTAAFGDAVAVYLCQDEPLQGQPSTVVDLAHGPAAILRAGGVDADAMIADPWVRRSALLDSPLSP